MSAMSSSSPTGDFVAPDHSQWEEAATKALRGDSLSSITHQTIDGFNIDPLYTERDHSIDHEQIGLPGKFPFTRGSKPANQTGWEIRQTHDALNQDANETILLDLQRGVTGITLKNSPSEINGLDRVLADVYLDLAPVHLAPGSNREQAEALLGLAETKSIETHLIRGNLGLDPARRAIRHAEPSEDLAQTVQEIAAYASTLASTHPNVTAIAVDASTYADLGASDSQEVGTALAIGLMWIRAFSETESDLISALKKIEFTFSAGPDQFMTIAKLRAARTCWARITQACGLNADQIPMRVHAITASTMMSQRDPWVNMLRTTTACFGAALGGADAITVQPFDAAIRDPEALGFRIARNTQLILQEETKAGAVTDPAGGSWYIEDLTKNLSIASWREFQLIEKNGGLISALDSGILANAFQETRQKRMTDIASRRAPITGVSEFPDLNESPIGKWEKRQLEELDTVLNPTTPYQTVRWSEPFEIIRDAAETADQKPSIFLANLGDLPSYSARSTFAKNLFEAGGITVNDRGGFFGASDTAKAFLSSGCQIACICSSDSIYSQEAESTAMALKQSGATLVFLAGHQGDKANQLRAAGVDDFIFIGCDVLELLSATLRLFTNEASKS
ncbi:MAG: methylmalonyl-CoA mutase [Candidatus Poriferisodalaceae bacterium]|jgi:methylmalonyl-CoA mutase|tara:strand:+ start:393 stop:2264 length:1872 start_codon:yes stop_codon:yes gene_type:complete